MTPKIQSDKRLTNTPETVNVIENEVRTQLNLFDNS